jgi:hypothetical protein
MRRCEREFSKDGNLVEPYSSVMMGNLEDGVLVGRGGVPKARKHFTLSWPLTPVPPVES